MKTTLSFIMTIVMIISLTACGGQSSVSSTIPLSPPVPEPSASSEGSIPESVQSQKTAQTESSPQNTGSEPDTEDTTRVLVAYFSATGTTKTLAESLAGETGGNLYEIVPEVTYTADDLNYNDDNSRSTKEQNDDTARPTISGSVDGIAQYDIIFLGYPIWNGTAPKIMSTFLESYDLTGKTIVPFCSSGGSSIGSSAQNLHALVADDVTWLEGQRFGDNTDQTALEQWVESLELGLSPAA